MSCCETLLSRFSNCCSNLFGNYPFAASGGGFSVHPNIPASSIDLDGCRPGQVSEPRPPRYSSQPQILREAILKDGTRREVDFGEFFGDLDRKTCELSVYLYQEEGRVFKQLTPHPASVQFRRVTNPDYQTIGSLDVSSVRDEGAPDFPVRLNLDPSLITVLNLRESLMAESLDDDRPTKFWVEVAGRTTRVYYHSVKLKGTLSFSLTETRVYEDEPDRLNSGTEIYYFEGSDSSA